jgi:hypothetical protein
MKIRLPLSLAFASFFIILNLADSIYAQSQEPIRVYLTVSGDEQIENEVRSYISRELRSLKNVLLVVNDQDLSISILAQKDKAVNGKFLGSYTMSVVVTSHLQEDLVRRMLYSDPRIFDVLRDGLMDMIKSSLQDKK